MSDNSANLVGCMLVGNEEYLVEPAIQNALRQGVQSFVIVETASLDCTAKVLRKYCEDPRFDITFLTPENVYGQDFLDPANIWQSMIERARTRFDADWILRMDADEFIMTGTRSIQEICGGTQADALSIKRLNVVAASPDFDFHGAARDPGQLPALQVVARPFPNRLIRSGTFEGLPLIVSEIVSKPICRAAHLCNYSDGGHFGLTTENTQMDHQSTSDLWFVHFWFTTQERFVRKCEFINRITETVRSQQKGGWQWNRWGALSDADSTKALAEFANQFVGQERLDILTEQGRVTRADAAPERFIEDSAADMDAHIAQLGWDRLRPTCPVPSQVTR